MIFLGSLFIFRDVKIRFLSDYNLDSVRIFTFEYEFLHLACNHLKDCYNALYKRL